MQYAYLVEGAAMRPLSRIRNTQIGCSAGIFLKIIKKLIWFLKYTYTYQLKLPGKYA
jgi:hypothetical protein